MKTAILVRMPDTNEGTFGYIAVDGLYWRTLELPNRDNKPNISRVPTGEYICKLRYSPRFKRKLYCLQDVKGRSYILTHGANFAGDIHKGWQSHLNGCIALGKSTGSFKNKFGNLQKCVYSSQRALREFMDCMNDEDFKIIIQEV